MRRGIWLTLALWLVLPACASAQFQDDPLEGDKPGQTAVQRWRIGMIVTAQGSGFHRIVGTVAVPTDWPDQRVRVVEEDLSPGVSVRYQTIEDTARQMVVRIPSLGAGKRRRPW